MKQTSGFRMEKDSLGERQIPADALYGIHTLRAVENFPLSGRRIDSALISAYGAVKLACLEVNHDLGYIDSTISGVLAKACREMMAGELDAYILVDAFQGGAGTSTNMNVNEVLANRALLLMGTAPGFYDIIHPIDHVNRHQSTNDTYPTAFRLAAVTRLQSLEQALISLLEGFQRLEKETAHVVKIGRTQLQDAVLTTMGRTMGAYAEAIARDRWRIYKCVERLRVVNLGGTAIGSGISSPRAYIFRVVERLKQITGIGFSRAENLLENTQNTDVFTEVSGLLSACAVNLIKISGDLRLMASGPDGGLGELKLPAVQAGSSLMPSKVNPVIPEAVTQAALRVQANHQLISSACASGNLELNAFMPLIADALLESINLLSSAVTILNAGCLNGLSVNEDRCRMHLENSVATLTALVPKLGYEKAQELAAESERSGRGIRELIVTSGIMTEEAFRQRISPEAVNRLGNPPEEELK